MMIKKAMVIAISILGLAAAANAKDASDAITSGAKASVEGSVTSVSGRPFEASADSAGGAVLVLVGLVMGVDDLVEMSVENAANGSKATIAVSASAVKKLGVVTGQTITAVSEATGYSLVYSGQILAFVPNAVGTSLLEHTPVSADASAPATAGK
ncbi:hypothetical protein GCM10010971_01710 [Silvimonas amylolytica]|uniref:Uncharacterized protein n=2 Tax=Silvimonas amylolytica TaxID=449663 RepID=A0ABQ2PGH6_9NEIS|nr:hypothetical protein GCM10010971_01710 [Silvimonas amylolytica]